MNMKILRALLIVLSICNGFSWRCENIASVGMEGEEGWRAGVSFRFRLLGAIRLIEINVVDRLKFMLATWKSKVQIEFSTGVLLFERKTGSRRSRPTSPKQYEN